MAQGIWKTLGIKRTVDRRAIRSAYAEKLRSIDVDVDPEAFAALREAYERALAGAVAHAQGELPPEPGEDGQDEPDDSADAVSVNAGVQAFHEIAEILGHSPSGAHESDIEVRLLNEKMETLLHWLEQAPIDEAQQAEFGIAHVLATTIPRSDGLLEAAAAHFGWMESAGDWDKPETVREIVQRIATNRYFNDLHNDGHPLHKAFLALTAQQPQKFWERPARKPVKELLSLGYRTYPGLISAFNPERVGEWERLTKLQIAAGAPINAGLARWHYVLGAIVILNGLRLLASALTPYNAGPLPAPKWEQVDDRSNSAPTARQIYLDPAADIADAIDTVFSNVITAQNLRDSNPEAYRSLVDAWQTAKQKQLPAYHMKSEIILQMTRIFEALVRESDSNTLQRYWKIRQRMTTTLPEMCDTIFAAGVHEAFDPVVTRDYQRLMGEVLRRSSRLPPAIEGSRSFSIPGSIIDKAERLTSLDHARFMAAMRGDSNPMGHCEAKMALISVLLNEGSASSAKLLQKF